LHLSHCPRDYPQRPEALAKLPEFAGDERMADAETCAYYRFQDRAAEVGLLDPFGVEYPARGVSFNCGLSGVYSRRNPGR